MATVEASAKQEFLDNNLYSWTPLTTTNSDGAPCYYTGSGDRTVQVTGTFGSGGTVVIEGTLDGTNFATLKDAGGTALSITAAGVRSVLENVLAIRPRVTAGDGTTSLTVTLCVRKR